MVIDQSYRISVFGDYSGIQPTPDNMLFFIKNFGKSGLVPSVFQEVQLTPGGGAIQLQRVALVSSDNLTKISIMSNRIDYEITSSVDKRLSESDRNTINTKISDSFGLIFKHFNVNAYRLALNAESFVVDLNDSQIKEFLDKYSNPISLYNDTIMGEWNTRLMVRKTGVVNELTEVFNVITTISKAKLNKRVDNKDQEKDGFTILVDINTIGENSTYRFSNVHIVPFFQTISIWWDTIISEMEG